MLPKSERLTQEDFKVIRPKVFFRGVLFEAACAPSSVLKFACVISKKKIKTAIGRNTIKRKVLTAVREVKQTTAIKNMYIVFYIKAIPNETQYTTIKEEIIKAFATLQ